MQTQCSAGRLSFMMFTKQRPLFLCLMLVDKQFQSNHECHGSGILLQEKESSFGSVGKWLPDVLA